MDLCKHLLACDCPATLVAPSNISSSIPSFFSFLPGVTILQVASSPGPPMPSSADPARQQAIQDLSDHLAGRIKEVFWKFDVPVVAFFTFSACVAAMELGSWKAEVGDVRPGDPNGRPDLGRWPAIARPVLEPFQFPYTRLQCP